MSSKATESLTKKEGGAWFKCGRWGAYYDGVKNLVDEIYSTGAHEGMENNI